MDNPAMRLVMLDTTFDEIGDNIDYYTWITNDEHANQATDRLIELVAHAMQHIATDIIDTLAEQPDLTATQIAHALRQRAVRLCPTSAKAFLPDDNDYVDPLQDALATANRTVAALGEQGVNAHVTGDSTNDSAAVIVDNHPQYRFVVTREHGERAWTIEHGPEQRLAPLAGLGITATITDVADAIQLHTRHHGAATN